MNDYFQSLLYRNPQYGWIIKVGETFWSGMKTEPLSEEENKILEEIYQKYLNKSKTRILK